MNYLFFYISIASLWLLLLTGKKLKPVKKAGIIIAIVTFIISLAYDITFGEILGLYHYISPSISLLYIILAGIFIYPPANIIYTMFLPENPNSACVYSILWIAAMLIFEYASITAGTVVFTGWNAFPWSPVTYVGTYIWVNLLYRYYSNINEKVRI